MKVPMPFSRTNERNEGLAALGSYWGILLFWI